MSFKLPKEKKRIIEDVVGVFETGKVGGDYATAVYLPDGAGITYGKHQAIDRSDSLDAIVQRYIVRGGGMADDLRPYESLLEDDGTVGFNPKALPANVKTLMGLLTKAAADPLMRQAQDEIFDEWYWEPAAKRCLSMGLVLPLSWLAVYDSSIHSGPAGVDRTRNRFDESPPAKGGDEKKWTLAYINARRHWLATHSKTILHATVYRMDAMLKLIDEGNWDLATPFQVPKPRATIK